MPHRISSTATDSNGRPYNGASISAYKASRFTTPPTMNTALPPGTPDATAISTTADGAPGAYEITLPTEEDYWLAVFNPAVPGTIGWQLAPYDAPSVAGGLTLDSTDNPHDIAASPSPGAAATASPSDHVHRGFVSPMTAQDDIIIGGASGAPVRLAKGTAGQILGYDPTTGHLTPQPAPSGGGSTPLDNESQASVLINATSAGAAANRADHFAGTALDTTRWTVEGGTYDQLSVAYSTLGLWTNSGTRQIVETFTPTGAFTITARLRLTGVLSNLFAGMMVRDSGTDPNAGDIVLIELIANQRSTAGNDSVSCHHHDTGGAWTQVASQPWFVGGRWMWLQMRGNAATGSFNCYTSDDRNDWAFIGTVTKTITIGKAGIWHNSGHLSVDLWDVEA